MRLPNRKMVNKQANFLRWRWARALLLTGASLSMFGALGLTATRQTDDPSRWNTGLWRSWRDERIRLILAPSGAGQLLNREAVIARSAVAFHFVEPLLKDPSFLKDEGRAKVLANFVRFVKAQSLNSDTAKLGLDISDADYWNSVSGDLQFPDLLRSNEFLQEMRSPRTYLKAVRLIETMNGDLRPDQKWIVFAYRSRFIKSADQTTYGRLLVLVPDQKSADGDVVDKWIQFAIASPEEPLAPDIRSVSMIVIRRNPAASDSHKAFFMDFMRVPNTDSIDLVPTATMEKSPSKNCYDCHKSSVAPIHPKLEYVFDEAGNLRKVSGPTGGIPEILNERIAAYGRGDLGHLDTSAYGPCLASEKAPASDDFIAAATTDSPIPAASYPRIRDSMSCSTCHERFAPINYPQAMQTHGDLTAFEQKKGIVQTYIENGWMPPKNTLTSAERHALWSCLMKQYFDPQAQTGLFVDWLKGNR